MAGFNVSLMLSQVGAKPEVGVASLRGIVVLRQRGLRSEACRRDRHCDVRRNIVCFSSGRSEFLLLGKSEASC
jgi:hypothetical protein